MRALLLLPLLATASAAAQPGARPDTLDLLALHAAAEARDPRAVQPAILERAAALRIEALRTSRLPQIALSGQATVQSDAPSVALPDGSSLGPPLTQTRIQAEADWALYDGGRTSRRVDVERARLAEGVAGAEVTLYALREAVTETFFAVFMAENQYDLYSLAEQELSARLRTMRARAAEGAALDADADVLEAELIRARQRMDEAEAQSRTAVAVLADLTGLPLTLDALYLVPIPDEPVPADALAGARIGDRPELRRIAATEARAEAEARLADSARQPMVSLFGQAGIGRPSPLDFLSDSVQEYALAGVRVRWAPVDWGRARREAEASRLQADVARADAEAFEARILRETIDDREEIARLTEALEQDDRAIALREEALRVARRQLDEGVLPSDAYAARLTAKIEAHRIRSRHEIERARARVRLLTTLGLFPDLPTNR